MQGAVRKVAPGEYEERFITARDGIRLFFRAWVLNASESRGVVALVHGFAEHCGRYDGLAEALNAAGWSVAALDYRGHGQAGGRRAHIEHFSEYLDDIHSFLDEIARGGMASRPVLLGHSQGGLISARFSELYPDRLARVVLSSPFFGLAIQVQPVKSMAGRLISRFLPAFSMPTGLDPVWLSHEKSVVDAYRSDPLVSRSASARWFTEVLEAQQITLEEARKLSLPLLVLAAGQDKVVSLEDTRRFVAAVGSASPKLVVYRDLYHEVFNEASREQVISDLIGWLQS